MVEVSLITARLGETRSTRDDAMNPKMQLKIQFTALFKVSPWAATSGEHKRR